MFLAQGNLWVFKSFLNTNIAPLDAKNVDSFVTKNDADANRNGETDGKDQKNKKNDRKETKISLENEKGKRNFYFFF